MKTKGEVVKQERGSRTTSEVVVQKRGSGAKAQLLSYLALSFLPRLIFSTSLLFHYLPTNLAHAKLVGKGGKPGELLTYGVGARSFGMGRAFVSVANDASAPVWNPGGLGAIDRSEITALHTILFADTSLDFLSFVMPSLDTGTFGLSVLYLSSAGFEGRDLNNIVTTPFTNTQFSAGASYGARFSDHYSAGLSLKYFSNSLASSSSGAMTFALGALANPVGQLWLGMTISNLISMDIGDPTSDKIPVVIRGGVSYRLAEDQLTVGLDYDSNFSGWYAGGEYRLFRPSSDQPLQIFLRGGANFEELTMGFGAWYQEYGIDYAFSTQELGGSHRFSMTVRFGESMLEAREVRKKSVELADKAIAQREYRDGQEYYKNGQYEESVTHLAKALELDPSLIEAKLLKEKMNVIIRYFKKSPEDEAGQFLRKAVGYWVDGDNSLAMDGFSYTVSKNLDESNTPRYEGLIKAFMDRAGIRGSGPVSNQMTVEPVASKLFKVRGLWLERKYADMVPLCQEVIQLEQTNYEAYLLLGTAHYSIGSRERAIDAWKKGRQYGLQKDPATGKPYLSDAQVKQLDEHIKQATEELKGGPK